MGDFIQFLIVAVVVIGSIIIKAGQEKKKNVGLPGIPQSPFPTEENDKQENMPVDMDSVPVPRRTSSAESILQEYVHASEVNNSSQNHYMQSRFSSTDSHSKVSLGTMVNGSENLSETAVGNKMADTLKSHKGARQAFIYSEIFNRKYE